MVFGVGGGKALDTVKCLCITDDKPVFTFPTIASNCAACTSVSIMYNSDGTFLKPNFFVRPAMHAFIDTEIIAKAPVRYMWAGIGDTYAKYYEACISSRDERLEHFTALGVSISVMCQKPLLEYGAKAYEDHKKGLCTYEVEQVILAIVVTTGIASIFLTKDYTPDYNSGLAHAIFYALTSYPVIEKNHLHGEIVGFGVLLALLVDGQDEEFEKIKNYIINPVESRVASLEMPESLNIKSDVPADIARIDGFIDMSDDEVEAYHSSMGFAMSIADLCWVRDYFKNEESIVYYEDMYDCCKKAEYYLLHEDKRRQIAAKGHELVSKKHSYINRVKYILDVIGKMS